VVLQIDDQPPRRLSESDDGLLKVSLAELNPGSHRFSAWAAYPWGEAVNSPGATISWRLHRWQSLPGTQPDQEAPWLVPIVPTSWRSGQPLLLNWLIWNAPLQNLREGDQRWKLRLSLDGNSVLVDQQEAIWLKGPSQPGGVSVQMELLDGLGEPLTPVFNNRLIHIEGRSGERAAWYKNHLSDGELATLSGTAPEQSAVLVEDPETIADEADQPEPALENDEPLISSDTESNSLDTDFRASISKESESGESDSGDSESGDSESKGSTSKELDDVSESRAESETGLSLESGQAEPEIKAETDREADTLKRVQASGEEPLLVPQSSLGGSARELLELN
jgi:hypothetical protein